MINTDQNDNLQDLNMVNMQQQYNWNNPNEVIWNPETPQGDYQICASPPHPPRPECYEENNNFNQSAYGQEPFLSPCASQDAYYPTIESYENSIPNPVQSQDCNEPYQQLLIDDQIPVNRQTPTKFDLVLTNSLDNLSLDNTKNSRPNTRNRDKTLSYYQTKAKARSLNPNTTKPMIFISKDLVKFSENSIDENI